VYAGTLGVPHGSVLNGHVFKTTDAGQHWQSTNHTDPGWTRVDSLTADPRHPGTLYAGTGVAVYKTVNGGSSWRAWSRGLLPGRNPRSGVGDPGWRRVEGWVTSLAVDPANSKVVYAAAGGIRKSTDGGHTWRVLRAGTSLADGASTLAIAPTSPHVVYAIWYHHSTSVYESANAPVLYGDSFHAVCEADYPGGRGAGGGDVARPRAESSPVGASCDRWLNASPSVVPNNSAMGSSHQTGTAVTTMLSRKCLVVESNRPPHVTSTSLGGPRRSNTVSGKAVLG
jgi:hypothetical protein